MKKLYFSFRVGVKLLLINLFGGGHMYFDGISNIDLDNLIARKEIIYAHIDGERKETLKEHMDLVLKYFYKIVSIKQLDNVFANFENKLTGNISKTGKLLYREMILNTIYMHDLGKINCNFQYKKMNNKKFKNKKGLRFNNSNHSMLSSLIYLNYFYDNIQKRAEKSDRRTLATFMLLNAYVISKHHGNFDSFDDFKFKFLDSDGEGKKLYTEEMDLYNEIYQQNIVFSENKFLLKRLFDIVYENLTDDKSSEKQTYIYIYGRFLASLLLACDYYATSHFKTQREIRHFGEIKDINDFYDTYKKTEIYTCIRKYENEWFGKMNNFNNVRDINVLRNELFLESERNLIKNIRRNIFYLEAPTGSGKSNVSFNLSFILATNFPELNKIFYVYPFNTLVEQNLNSLKKVFGTSDIIKDITVINSLVPIKTEKLRIDEDSDVLLDDYEIALLNRQFLHYPLILTTHISMFNYLFGTLKENLFPLYQIANSIIILDEIQSYKNRIWKEIITFLNSFSEVLNIRIIIMSATLPNLNKLINHEVETINLVENREKYYSNPIFRDRVKVDFSLLEVKENVIEVLLRHVIKTAKNTNGNILVEFIKKSTAMDFFKKLKEYYELSNEDAKKEIELITGDDNSVERDAIITKVKCRKNIILVATQVIEAGIDIDMDIGYKDISMLDAEEQFLGRINRSCLKEDSIVYFFNLDSATQIYKNDIRKEKNLSLLTQEIRKLLITKNFPVYYDYVLKTLNRQLDRYDDRNFNIFLNKYVGLLNYKDVEQRMKLIDEHYQYSVFLNRTIKLKNNESLNGSNVWNEYINLLKDSEMPYSEKRIKLSEVISKMNYFIYKVKRNNFTYEQRVGDIYYISDGDKYFVDGKFDREKFDNGNAEFI